MNRLRLTPPFPRGVGGDHYLIAFTTHLGLLYQEKNNTLTSDEKLELDHYLLLEHLVRLAKARAYQYMAENKADGTTLS
jgi:hypothetical protein